MSSSFFEYWQAQQAQQHAELQGQIEQARAAWVGRRVWFRGLGTELTYGEVTAIDDRGQVHILYAYDAQNRPLSVHFAGLSVLGRGVTLAQ